MVRNDCAREHGAEFPVKRTPPPLPALWPAVLATSACLLDGFLASSKVERKAHTKRGPRVHSARRDGARGRTDIRFERVTSEGSESKIRGRPEQPVAGQAKWHNEPQPQENRAIVRSRRVSACVGQTRREPFVPNSHIYQGSKSRKFR